VGLPGPDVPADPDEAVALYRSLLAGRRLLVLLDNAAGAEQVRQLLPAAPGCRVLVTSRDRLASLVALDGARRLDLDGLTEAEAVRLCGGIAGGDADPADAAALVRLCALLPLAVRVAAASIADHPEVGVAGYVARLRDGDRLAQLALDGDQRAAVRANLD